MSEPELELEASLSNSPHIHVYFSRSACTRRYGAVQGLTGLPTIVCTTFTKRQDASPTDN